METSGTLELKFNDIQSVKEFKNGFIEISYLDHEERYVENENESSDLVEVKKYLFLDTKKRRLILTGETENNKFIMHLRNFRDVYNDIIKYVDNVYTVPQKPVSISTVMKAGTCWDFEEIENIDLNSYLSKLDNAVLVLMSNGKLSQVTCTTLDRLYGFLNDKTNTFFECGNNRPNYLIKYYKLQMRDFGLLVNLQNLKQALDDWQYAKEELPSDEDLPGTGGVFLLRDTGRVLESTGSEDSMRGDNWVSGDHCQGGTAKKVYSIEYVKRDLEEDTLESIRNFVGQDDLEGGKKKKINTQAKKVLKDVNAIPVSGKRVAKKEKAVEDAKVLVRKASRSPKKIKSQAVTVKSKIEDIPMSGKRKRSPAKKRAQRSAQRMVSMTK